MKSQSKSTEVKHCHGPELIAEGKFIFLANTRILVVVSCILFFLGRGRVNVSLNVRISQVMGTAVPASSAQDAGFFFLIIHWSQI